MLRIPRPIRAVKYSMNFVDQTGELAKIATTEYIERYDILAKKRRKEYVEILTFTLSALLVFACILKNIFF